MKLTLTQIYITDKDKQGNPLIGKDRRPYTKIIVKAREYGDKWISGYVSAWNQNWKEGQVVDAEVEQKGQFLNLKRPDPMASITKQVERTEAMVEKIYNFLVEKGMKP